MAESQFWCLVCFVFNIVVVLNIKYILRCSLSLSTPQPTTFRAIKWPSVNMILFVNICQICVESVFSSVRPSSGKCVLYMYLVHFSLKTFRRLSVNIQLPFFVENKQLFTLNLTYGWLEMNWLWFFCSGLVLRLAEKGWVAMVDFVTL